jgi:hypothetical protein
MFFDNLVAVEVAISQATILLHTTTKAEVTKGQPEVTNPR